MVQHTCKAIHVLQYLNGIKDNSEKASDNIHHPFITKMLKKVEIEGKYPNMIMAIYDSPKPKSY